MNPTTNETPPAPVSLTDSRRPLDLLGLDMPPNWWPAPTALKAIEAAGFRWVQLTAPPLQMLADSRHSARYAQAIQDCLAITGLRPVLHAPANLRLGSSLHDHAFGGLLEVAGQIGAPIVVYHALDYPSRGVASKEEEASLARAARTAEAVGTSILLENTCPAHPGGSRLGHDPLSIRHLVWRIDTPAVGMMFDVGHAHVVADFMGVEVTALLEPVLDCVQAFHVHDNLGSRLGAPRSLAHDPLLLDLHLPPGAGAVPWEALRSLVVGHGAPILLEVAPDHRPSAPTLHAMGLSALGETEAATLA